MAVAFNWALIVLSSLAGASLIAEALAGGRPAYAILYIVVLIVGVVIQWAILRQERHRAA